MGLASSSRIFVWRGPDMFFALTAAGALVDADVCRRSRRWPRAITILQVVEQDERACGMSYYAMALAGMAQFGSVLAGRLASRLGAPNTLLITGAGYCGGSDPVRWRTSSNSATASPDLSRPGASFPKWGQVFGINPSKRSRQDEIGLRYRRPAHEGQSAMVLRSVAFIPVASHC